MALKQTTLFFFMSACVMFSVLSLVQGGGGGRCMEKYEGCTAVRTCCAGLKCVAAGDLTNCDYPPGDNAVEENKDYGDVVMSFLKRVSEEKW